MSHTKIKYHIPVLLRELIDTMNPKKGEVYLDLTAGYGGHASEILEITQSSATLVDRDEKAIIELQKRFSNNDKVVILHKDYLQTCKNLIAKKLHFDLILVDLGVSSPHLDNASRGFSIANSGPLDMRMDESQDLTAADVVNTYSKQDLTRVIREFGEEPKASRMAQLILQSRPINSTKELARIASKVWPGHSRSHPATRLFQAVRIEVNNELGQLEKALPLMVKLLSLDGRLGIISFHSLEDRIVKKFFKERSGDKYDAELTEINKRPITATQNELVINPRSRSAKLRVVAKIKTKKEGKG
jgi:16S rRNA (cytosine1402-N4)-methyltransferase